MRLTGVIFALALNCLMVDTASAYYSARLGRFLSRDPIGNVAMVLKPTFVVETAAGRFVDRDANAAAYVDGPNLYAAYFVPSALDPLGLCTEGEKRASAPMFEFGSGARDRFVLTAGPNSSNPDIEKIKIGGIAVIDIITTGPDSLVKGGGSVDLISPEYVKTYNKIRNNRGKLWILVGCETCDCSGEWQESSSSWYECDLTKQTALGGPNTSINEYYDNVLGGEDNNMLNLNNMNKKDFLKIVTECRKQAVEANAAKCQQ